MGAEVAEGAEKSLKRLSLSLLLSRLLEAVLLPLPSPFPFLHQRLLLRLPRSCPPLCRLASVRS